MPTLFQVSQELMPLIAPPATLAERAAHYRRATEYLSLRKVPRMGTPVFKYEFTLDLTQRRTATGIEPITGEADLTVEERQYRQLFSPCAAVLRILPKASLQTLPPYFDERYHISDAELAGWPDHHAVLAISPMPSVRIDWTRYVPLTLHTPDEIFLYPIDTDELALSLVPFMLDVHQPDAAGHLDRYYRQYLRTTDSPKPSDDTTFAVDLYAQFAAGTTSLSSRGGTPLGQLVQTDTLTHVVTVAFSSSQKNFLSEDETDAFFVYRQRMPVARAGGHGLLAGHPCAALVQAHQQLASPSVATARATAQAITDGAMVDFMRLDRPDQKYGHLEHCDEDVDHVDYDHHPNVMMLRARPKAENEHEFYAWLAADHPHEFLSGCSIYNPDAVDLYLQVPLGLEAGTPNYLHDINEAENLANGANPALLRAEQTCLYVRALTAAEALLEIRVRLTDADGPILKTLLVQVFEPRFMEARVHEVHAGELEIIAQHPPLVYGEDFDFVTTHRGDASQTDSILEDINFRGPGDSNTYSRFGNVFILNKTSSADYQPSQSGVVPLVDSALEAGLDAVQLASYVHEIHAGQPFSVLMVNRQMADPLSIFSLGFRDIVNYYDVDTELMIYFTWDLAVLAGWGKGVAGITPFRFLGALWHGRSQSVVVETGTSATKSRLSLVLFHEVCHRIAFRYGAYTVYDAAYLNNDVAYLTHPVTHALREELMLSADAAADYEPTETLMGLKALRYILDLGAWQDKVRHQFFPGNIMNPHGDEAIPAGADISPRLTFKQSSLLNAWLRPPG